jgi:hypothetical protein
MTNDDSRTIEQAIAETERLNQEFSHLNNGKTIEDLLAELDAITGD